MPANSDLDEFVNAIKRGRLDVAKPFFETHEIDINSRIDEQEILHFAVEQGSLETVEWLISVGANINARDSKGDTPLHLAVRTGKKDPVKLLLERGANYKATNYEKETLCVSTYKYYNRIERISSGCSSDIVFHVSFFDAIDIHQSNPVPKPETMDAAFVSYHPNEKPDPMFDHRPRVAPEVFKGNKATTELSRGLTPLDLARKENQWEIANLIVDFIFYKKQAAIQSIEKLNQLSSAEWEATMERSRPLLNHGSTAAFGLAFVFVGAAIFYGKKFSEYDGYQRAALLMISIGIFLIVYKVERALGYGFTHVGNFFSKNTETVVGGLGKGLAENGISLVTTRPNTVYAPANVNVRTDVNATATATTRVEKDAVRVEKGAVKGTGLECRIM